MQKNNAIKTISDSTSKRLIYAVSTQYLLARAIHVAAMLNIGKLLTEDPISFDHLCQEYESLNYENLLRLLKFLAHHGVLRVEDENTFFVTNMTKYLTSDNEDLITSNVTWCEQGDLFSYLKYHGKELSLFLTKDIKVTSDLTSISIHASPRDLIYLYSKFHLISRALHVAAKTNIIDFVSSNGVLDIEIYLKTYSIEKNQLDLLMRLLKMMNLVENSHTEWVFSKPFIQTLGDSDETIQPTLCMIDDAWWNSVSELESSLYTGHIPFDLVNSLSFFEYLQAHEESQKIFDKGLGCFSKEDDELVATSIDYSPYQSIVDIGGGYGGLLLHLFRLYSSSIKELILFEQAHRLNNVHPKLTPDKTSHKYKAVAGDFLAQTSSTNLPRNKDLYVIKGVLHDFDDQKVKQTLINTAHFMSETSELLVVERTLRSDNSLNINYSSDLLMLILLGGRERSMSDWLMLFHYSGLVCINSTAVPTAGDFSLIRCKKYQPSLIMSLSITEDNDINTCTKSLKSNATSQNNL